MRKHIALLAFLVTHTLNAESPTVFTCPTLEINAECRGGSWHPVVKIPDSLPEAKWQVSGEKVSKKQCASEGEHASLTKWNYAAQVARLGTLYCNYSLFDDNNNDLGTVQIGSPVVRRTGDNWESTYPGYWLCELAQDQCLLWKF